MFSRDFKFAVTVSVVAFLASTNGVPTGGSNNQCNTGELKCCQELSNSTDSLGGLLSIGSVLGDVGLVCNPVNVLGIGKGGDCQAQAACCTKVTQDGLVNFGCSPLNVNL